MKILQIIIIMKLFTIFTLLVIANYSLAKEPRVFCSYKDYLKFSIQPMKMKMVK